MRELSTWYSHENILTLKVTGLPADYPEAFEFQAGCFINKADYAGRGWRFFESAVANFVKGSSLILDLGKLLQTKVVEHESWYITS